MAWSDSPEYPNWDDFADGVSRGLLEWLGTAQSGTEVPDADAIETYVYGDGELGAATDFKTMADVEVWKLLSTAPDTTMSDASYCSGGTTVARIALEWTNGTPHSGSTTDIQRKAGTGSWVIIASGLALSTTSYTDTDVSTGTSYQYQLRHNVSGGTTTSWASATTSSGTTTLTPAVACPSGTPDIVAEPATVCSGSTPDYKVDLTWTQLSGWDVLVQYQENSTTGTWTTLGTYPYGTTLPVTHDHTNMGDGDTWYYRARYQHNDFGFTSTDDWSAADGATLSDVCAVPDPVGSVTATAMSSSQIDVSWTHDGANTDGYYVYRASSVGGTYSKIATINDSTARSYSDTGLTASTEYCYKVTAFNANGESADSVAACATTDSDGGGGGGPTPE